MSTQLWPIPVLGAVAGLALGVALPRLDAHVDRSLSAETTVYLFGGGPSAARTLLGAVSGSLVTVTSLTFSLTVVTLQLASSQFSPRLLRTFTRDRFVHVTLAVFLGTFTYALAVLRTVRDADGGMGAFVPRISVTLAFVLCVVSVVTLVLFLAHLAQEIRPETLLRRVHRDARATAARLAPRRTGAAVSGPDPVAPVDSALLAATASGFLVAIEEEALLAAAVDGDAVLLVDRFPGSSIVAGTPVGAAWPRSDPFAAGAVDELRRRTADAIVVGFERTDAQDIGYGLRQLTDVANKALSPGINDPTTAVHALGHCAALLCDLAGRDLGPRTLRDEAGTTRVILRRPELGDLLEAALTQPRRYGASDPFVLGRVLELLRELAWCVEEPRDHAAVAGQLARLRRTIAAQDFDASERASLERVAREVERVRSGRATSPP